MIHEGSRRSRRGRRPTDDVGEIDGLSTATAGSTFSIDDEGQKEEEDRPPGVHQLASRVAAQHLEKDGGQYNIDSHAWQSSISAEGRIPAPFVLAMRRLGWTSGEARAASTHTSYLSGVICQRAPRGCWGNR